MTDESATLAAEFDSLYQGGSAEIGPEKVRLDVIPWQIDGPQPVVVDLETAGEITDPVLECGCGFGDNALYLASRGHRVTAFDASPTVIAQDREKAARQGSDVDFRVADATVLDGITGEYATVVDSAMMHTLTDELRRDYLSALRRVCRPGARLHILCFSADASGQVPVPGSMDEESLRRDLSPGWTIERMRMAQYTTRLTREEWQQIVPEAVAGFGPNPDDPNGVDDRGRVLIPIWQITATRT